MGFLTNPTVKYESYQEYHWRWKCSVMSDSLWPHGLYSPWNSPSQSTGVGSLFLPQGIFPTQGLNPGLLQCRWIPYQLSYRDYKVFKTSFKVNQKNIANQEDARGQTDECRQRFRMRSPWTAPPWGHTKSSESEVRSPQGWWSHFTPHPEEENLQRHPFA